MITFLLSLSLVLFGVSRGFTLASYYRTMMRMHSSRDTPGTMMNTLQRLIFWNFPGQARTSWRRGFQKGWSNPEATFQDFSIFQSTIGAALHSQ
jgi:hypothetical protein